jgi:hypothetical protein
MSFIIVFSANIINSIINTVAGCFEKAPTPIETPEVEWGQFVYIDSSIEVI